MNLELFLQLHAGAGNQPILDFLSVTAAEISPYLVIACMALFNYWLAVVWGRPFFEKYGRYVLVSKKSLDKADHFFAIHGHISTFIGRQLPGIRQYISLPAGIARMSLPLFATFTGLGAGLWIIILALVGYYIGNNQELVNQYLHQIALGIGGFSMFLIIGYLLVKKRQLVAG